MSFEHDNRRPEYFKERWEGEYDIFSWLADAAGIPTIVFMVTTLKENGLPNACFEGWSCFASAGGDYYVIMTTLTQQTHTYRNIKRTGEFCINFLTPQYEKQCMDTCHNNADDADEFAVGGFTIEPAHTIASPRIKEAFLKLECQFEWEKGICPGSICPIICGKVKHISIDENYARSGTAERCGNNGFMVNIGVRNPFTGEELPGGVGRIEMAKES